MSAVFPTGPLQPDPDEIRAAAGRDAGREQLAAAVVFECGLTASAAEARAAVDKLWPVVDRIANERAAAALEAVAAELSSSRKHRHYVEFLRGRAAALRASNREGATT